MQQQQQQQREQQCWTTLRHNGVQFPSDYEPHGVPLLYAGRRVRLTPAQEEIATLYARLLDTPHVRNAVFKRNFWAGFRAALGRGHVVRSLDGCDFTMIQQHLRDRRARSMKKAVTCQQQSVFDTALVDGRAEPVGNYRVEPPSIFIGRGDHPKAGTIKRRIYPSDITINIGEGEPLPRHPYPGQKWGGVVHDRSVMWLARWADPVHEGEFKYVYLANQSSLKADRDQAKFEQARALGRTISRVRGRYEEDLTSADPRRRQLATVLYLVDRLALRAGHSAGGEAADATRKAGTVGACTLRCSHVKLLPPHSVALDFLGKDSIRYARTVDVDPRVYTNLAAFTKGKRPTERVFEHCDAAMLNRELKTLLKGLSAKVFRTYNASRTLDSLLRRPSANTASQDTVAKKAVYEEANRQVAVLCNHCKQQTTRGGGGAQQHALSTSKMNYLDPRITVAWCKRNSVPVQAVFSKALQDRFAWALDCPPSFRF